MARALVIGGTQFIGRALVERLLLQGDDVVIMHRATGTPFSDRVGEIQCDRNDIDAVRAALEGSSFDVVYDNVYDWQRGTTADQVRASALAARDGLRRYVFTSSVAAYGGGAYGGGDARDEIDNLAPDDMPDDYARNKAQSERALFALHEQHGVPVSTLRPAFVYGPHNPFDREAFFWDRILADRPIIIPGDGSRSMQWVHADDVARAAIRAAGEDIAVGKAYNLANPPITQLDYVHALAHAAEKDVRVVHISRERIAAAGGGLFAPPFYFGVYLDLPPLTMRVERVETELGLELTPFVHGLRDTFRWYSSEPRPVPDVSWEDALIAST